MSHEEEVVQAAEEALETEETAVAEEAEAQDSVELAAEEAAPSEEVSEESEAE